MPLRRMRVRSLRAAWLASLPAVLRDDLISQLLPKQAQALLQDWPFWARDKQLPPPGAWRA